jgi:hypothetical protein
LEFGGVSIPFSAQKYYEDPDGFFFALGVQKPEGGYSPDVVTFTQDGDVVVAFAFFNLLMIERGAVELESAVDVPRTFVSDTGMRIIKPQEETDVWWLVGITGIGVGCLIAVVLLVVAVRTVFARRMSRDDERPDIVAAPLALPEV